MTGKPTEPYDFVPLGRAVRRDSPTWHHRYHNGTRTGHLKCILTVKTPLFVYHPKYRRLMSQGHERVRFPCIRRVAFIPGSSLKGVLRSVAEAVAQGCVTLPASWPSCQQTYSNKHTGRSITVRIPSTFVHCRGGGERPERLCLVCSLFGSLYPGEQWSYRGKVALGDARASQEDYTLHPFITLKPLFNPRPEERRSCYTLGDGSTPTIAGRKFYRHRYPEGAPDVLESWNKDKYNKTVQPVDVGSTFAFEVDYEDLTREELELLIYSLVLEEGMWHKIGMGKPLGLGSAEISIVAWHRIDPTERYRTLGGGTTVLEGDDLRAEVNNWTLSYREREDASLRKLRELLRPDPDADVRYQIEEY